MLNASSPLLPLQGIAGVLLAAYLVGSVPFAYLIPKLCYGLDIREHGSGNVGATNVLRTCGKTAGIFAYLLDGLKGFLPIWMLKSSLPLSPWLWVMAAFLLLLGHSRSLFLGGKAGGKAAMSGLGALFALSPTGGWIIAALAISVIVITRTVSVGTMSAACLTWLIMLLLGEPLEIVLYTVVSGIWVLYKHRANLQRLLQGKELTFR
jgi:acyl phosphate:glycerol-3-phosphate acyltransferase